MDELTDKDLARGYWFITHRERIRYGIISVVGIFLLGVIVYAGWQFMDWLSSRTAEEESLRLLVSSSVNVEEYRQRNAPLPLELGKVMAVPAAMGKYDFIVQVKNPNLKWAARQADYSFHIAGQSFNGSSFVLPLEDKFFLKLGVNLDKLPAGSTVSVNNINWQRIRDFKNFTTPDFAVSGEKIEQVGGEINPAKAGTRLTFTLTNQSPYSFWQVPVTAVLTNNSHVAAISQQVLASIDSSQAIPMEFYWPEQTFSVDRLVVKPEVNVLDPQTIKPLR